MTSRNQIQSCQWALCIALAIPGCPSDAGAEVGFVENFSEDPIAAARMQVHDGAAARFVYQPASRSLLARYNSGQPTARLVRPLCRALTERSSFEFKVVFRIRSAGFFADPRRHAQIAFGLMNASTTGADRVYGQNGQGAYDLVSCDYFPNISAFGGPSAGPTLISSNTGTGFSSSIHFDFGPETEMNDPGEAPLPLDQWLTAEVKYEGAARQATLRILQAGQSLPLNTIGRDYEPGGPDADPGTITTNLTATSFTVDTFGLLLWADASATFTTLTADVDFQSIEARWKADGDFDFDGDVDADDVAHMRSCQSGPTVPQDAAACKNADLDCDGDVDQEDFGLFQVTLTVPQ